MIDLLQRALLGDGDEELVVIDLDAGQDALGEAAVVEGVAVLHADEELIEERLLIDERSLARGDELLAERVGAVEADLGGLLDALLAHDGAIDGGEERHQALVGADVGRGLLAADVLLAGLEREDEGALAAVVLGLADDASGDLADQLLRAAHVAGVGTTKGHRQTEALDIAHGDVGSPLARGLHQGEVGDDAVDDEEGLLVVAGVGHAREVLDHAVVVGLLGDEAGDVAPGELVLEILLVRHAVLLGDLLELDAVEVGVGLEDGDRLRVERGAIVMQPEPVYRAYKDLEKDMKKKPRVVYLTPQGTTFHQEMAKELAKEEELVFLCGHYEGIDERVLEEIVTDYVSIGDYVLTGGELPAMVMIDSISRLVPGVLHNDDSAGDESFENGLLEYPQYTRPPVFLDKEVPEVLLSGHHENIRKWRHEQSVKRTKERRPDLWEAYEKEMKEKDGGK